MLSRAAVWQAGLIALLLAAAWLVTDHFPPWTGFHAELPAVLAGAVAVAYALGGRGAAHIGPVPGAFLVLAAVPWIQWASGLILYRGDAALASAYLAGTGLCVWAGQVVAPPVRQRTLLALAAVMLAVSIVSTGIGLYQWFGLEGLQIWGARIDQGSRTAGNLAQSNHMATVLAFGVASAVWLRARGHLGSGTTCATAAFLLLGLAMTQSRGVWLAAGAMGAWMLARPASLLTPLRLRAAPVLLLAGWYTVVLWAVVVLPEPLLLTDGVAGTARLASTSGRQVMWTSWWRAIEMSPWVGHGWQQGHLAQGAAALGALAYAYSGYAHSVVLDLLAWNGLPLGVIVVAAGGWWYVRLGLRAEGSDQWLRFAVLTVFATHALVEYPHAYAYFLVPVALLVGQSEASGPPGSRWAVPRALLAAVTVLCVGFAAAAARDYLIIDADIRVLRAQKQRIGGVWTSEAPKDILVLDQMQALVRALRIEARTAMAPTDLDELLRVSHRFPMRHLLQEAAAALALNDREREAFDEMRRLYGMYGKAGYAAALAALKVEAPKKGSALMRFVAALEAAGQPQFH